MTPTPCVTNRKVPFARPEIAEGGADRSCDVEAPGVAVELLCARLPVRPGCTVASRD